MTLTMAVIGLVACCILIGLLLWSFANDGPVSVLLRKMLLLMGIYAFGATSAVAVITVHGYKSGYLYLANVSSDVKNGSEEQTAVQLSRLSESNEPEVYRPRVKGR